MIYLSVIVPAYNEEKRIDHCLRGLTNYLWHYTHYLFEIIVVDNGSTDNTLEIVTRWQHDWPQLRAISIPERGKGLAIKTGMLAATGNYRYMCDVDLATPANQLVRYLVCAQGGNNDVVIGSRQYVKMTPKRWAMHKIFQALTMFIVPGIQDTQCGFKMFTARAALEIFPRVQTKGLAFDVEVLHIARRRGFQICEMPVEWLERSGSRIRPVRDGLAMIMECLAILARRDLPTLAIPAAEARRQQ
jgi:dolichyl-phosphate beta-glucosyltransferase